MDVKPVIEPNFSNAVNLPQAPARSNSGVAQATGEGVDDLGAAQAPSTWPSHGQNEGPAKTLFVIGIELLQAFKLCAEQWGQACLVLLLGRFSGELASNGCFARQFRVGSNQSDLLGA